MTAPIGASRTLADVWPGSVMQSCGHRPDKTKTARFCRAVFSFHKPDFLFAVAEAPRPPSGAAGLGVVGRLGSGLGRGGGRCRLRLAAIDRCRRIRLGI